MKRLFILAVVIGAASCASEDRQVQPRTILTIFPVAGIAGMPVFVKGYQTKASEDFRVSFGDKPAVVLRNSGDELKVEVPAGVSGQVSIETEKETIRGPLFRYYDVTLVGILNNSIIFWKNDMPDTLGSFFYGEITDVAFTTNDILISGNWNGQYGYYVNKVFHPTDTFSIIDIEGVGGDVYAVGGSASTFGYLKNDTFLPLPLAAGFTGGQATVIKISGSDVYVGGYQITADDCGYIYSVATVWKNGVVETMSDMDSDSKVVDMAISGSTVYVLGNSARRCTNLCYYAYNCEDRGLYWKNGIEHVLEGASSVSCILVSGSDIYVAGIMDGDARVWKNGQLGTVPKDPYPGVYKRLYLADGNLIIFGTASNHYGVPYSICRINDHLVRFDKKGQVFGISVK